MLISPLLLALSALLLFPAWRLFFFAPYLTVLIYKKSRLAALWGALGCGVFLDLLASNAFFGITALTYVLTTFLLYGQKRNFFEDKISTLPIMTFLFSFLATAIYFTLELFSGTKLSLSWEWVISDLFVMPFFDALYALIWFALPFQLTRVILKIRKYAYFRKSRR